MADAPNERHDALAYRLRAIASQVETAQSIDPESDTLPHALLHLIKDVTETALFVSLGRLAP
jgi:hypothetical protein